MKILISLISAVLVSSILVMSGCGDMEDEQLLISLQKELKVSSVSAKYDRIKKVNLAVPIRQVSISISDEEDRLFLTDSNSEFSINTIIDVYIGVKFIGYSGIHNIKINTYLPDGNLYRSKSLDIDFSISSLYSSNDIIVEIESSSAIIKDIIPIAGTEIAIFNLIGNYKVEVLLDQNVVAVSNFILK